MNSKKPKPKESSNIFQLLKSNPVPPVDPLFIKMAPFDVIKSELRYAARYFQNLRMLESAKWLSELLNSMTSPSESSPDYIQTYIQNNCDPNTKGFHTTFIEEETPNDVEDALLQIRSLFDLREYKRCAFVAGNFLELFPSNQTILFFKVYAIFIKEKLKREEEKADKSLESLLIRKHDNETSFE